MFNQEDNLKDSEDSSDLEEDATADDLSIEGIDT